MGSVKLNNAQVKIMLMRHMTTERNYAEACVYVCVYVKPEGSSVIYESHVKSNCNLAK